MEFSRQLERLWEVLPALKNLEKPRPNLMAMEAGKGFVSLVPPKSKAELAAHHRHYGFEFVPLVTADLDLLCAIDILLLRPDRPGSLVWAGDIDNRIKTLLDAMRIPETAENYAAKTDIKPENPIFCLLEDDKLITRISVDTDRLLQDVDEMKSPSDVRLFINVAIKPYELDLSNMHFG